jgi:putative FmdB family regulatory protein
MPTYEYNCRLCGETLEVFQAFKDKPLKRHDACGGELRKVLHARGIVFKGSGFYATERRGSSSNGSSGSSDSKDSKAPKETSAKSESKSTTATD